MNRRVDSLASKWAILMVAIGMVVTSCQTAVTPTSDPPSASTQTPPGPPASSTSASAFATYTVTHTATATSLPTIPPTRAPTDTPSPTLSPTPSPTATDTPVPTPTPTPVRARRYQMRYEIEHPTVLGQETLVDQLWLPLPNTDGDGTRDLEIIEIYPGDYEILDIGEANQAAYWSNVPDLCAQTDCRFGVLFEVTLERPMYAIPWNAPPSYDTESELFKTYTQPQRGIESDDPALLELAEEIVAEERNIYKRVLLLQSWVEQNILYPDLGSTYPDDALLCIDKGFGDCAGQSKVFVALCRALGIPARSVSGLLPFSHGIGQLEQFGPRAAWFDRNLSVHVWCEVYLPPLGWVQVEPDMPGFGIDKERLIVRRGPFSFPGGVCRHATYFHLPLGVQGDWCGQSVGWEVSIDAEPAD